MLFCKKSFEKTDVISSYLLLLHLGMVNTPNNFTSGKSKVFIITIMIIGIAIIVNITNAINVFFKFIFFLYIK